MPLASDNHWPSRDHAMLKIIGDGIVVLGVCLVACVVPTRRAFNIEPTIALRTE